ncbi:hypothetical protein HDU67_004772 [Dinochytrium kinnereticum]|nr:hypothetical protein HDU67_004772 [Dinochytrium kinnereticum]
MAVLPLRFSLQLQTLLLTLLLLVQACLSQSSYSFSDTQNLGITFAGSLHPDNTARIALTVPSGIAWISIGYGKEMNASFMHAFWVSPDLSSVVVSNRDGVGHSAILSQDQSGVIIESFKVNDDGSWTAIMVRGALGVSTDVQSYIWAAGVGAVGSVNDIAFHGRNFGTVDVALFKPIEVEAPPTLEPPLPTDEPPLPTSEEPPVVIIETSSEVITEPDTSITFTTTNLESSTTTLEALKPTTSVLDTNAPVFILLTGFDEFHSMTDAAAGTPFSSISGTYRRRAIPLCAVGFPFLVLAALS